MSTIEYNGYETGLYTNNDFSSRYFSDEVLYDNNLWIAQYRSECTFKKPYIMWQYTENGRVNGINSNVDLNYTTLKFNKYNGEGTGWVNKNDNTYFVKDNANKAIGWNEIDGKWYYFNAAGVMKTGWILYGNTWYYLKDNGQMAIGWYEVGEKWYYSDGSGAMQTGWLLSRNIWYYLKSNGEMATNTTIDGWKIDSNGVATKL